MKYIIKALEDDHFIKFFVFGFFALVLFFINQWLIHQCISNVIIELVVNVWNFITLLFCIISATNYEKIGD